MAPPNPKNPNRPRRAAAPPKRRPPTVELPFDDADDLDGVDEELTPAPVQAGRSARRQEEAIPTTVYEFGDEEFPPSYDPRDVTDAGHKPAYLYVEKGPGAGQLLPVKQGATVIGRASVSELRLQHPSVSRRHAQLTRLGDRFYLKDLGSQNATYVNKVRVETEIEVYPGDQLQIGTAVVKLRGAAEKVPEDVRRKIDKAGAVAARRARATPRVEETERRQRPLAGSGNTLRVALACTAIGFGLAVLGFVVLKVLSAEPSFQELPAAPTPIAVQPPTIQVEAPVVAVAQPDPALEPEPVEVVAEDDLAAERERELAQQAVSESVAATPPKSPSAAVVARREQPSAKVREQRRQSAPKLAAVTERQAPAASSRAEILKRYEDGDVAGAIAAATLAKDAELAQRLTDFQSAYSAGARAEKAGDGTAAIKAYQAALAVDEKISGGWGKHGPALSRKLGNLYTRVGQYYLRSNDRKNAALAFKAALKYDPQNTQAKQEQAALSSAPSPAPAPAKRADAIEDAWEDSPAPARAPAPSKKAGTREARASAIEEAWGD